MLSTFQMAQDGGAIVGPILVGVVADRFGFGPAFLVTGLVVPRGRAPVVGRPRARSRTACCRTTEAGSET